VYGTSNNSIIEGAFIIRGDKAEPAFDVAPDWESYEFKKLDPKSADDQKFVDNMWSWENGIKVGGKEYPHADGKVFK
jgi:elongation factor 1-gamma